MALFELGRGSFLTTHRDRHPRKERGLPNVRVGNRAEKLSKSRAGDLPRDRTLQKVPVSPRLAAESAPACCTQRRESRRLPVWQMGRSMGRLDEFQPPWPPLGAEALFTKPRNDQAMPGGAEVMLAGHGLTDAGHLLAVELDQLLALLAVKV